MKLGTVFKEAHVHLSSHHHRGFSFELSLCMLFHLRNVPCPDRIDPSHTTLPPPLRGPPLPRHSACAVIDICFVCGAAASLSLTQTHVPGLMATREELETRRRQLSIYPPCELEIVTIANEYKIVPMEASVCTRVCTCAHRVRTCTCV